VELRFTLPQLRKLDLAGTEVLVCGLAEGERPPKGVAGLVDWRLAGRLSRLVASGFVSGALGETLLVPGRPKLPFDKILLFGVGTARDFSELVFRAVVEKVLATLEGLKARTAVVELPGRHFTAFRPNAPRTSCSRSRAGVPSTTPGRSSSRSTPSASSLSRRSSSDGACGSSERHRPRISGL